MQHSSSSLTQRSNEAKTTAGITVKPSTGKPQQQEKEHHQSFTERIKHYIGNYSQAPTFIKDNAFIHSGYRINFESFRSAWKSLFMVHNELVNIWSHFVGAILVIILCVYLSTAFGNIDFVSWKQTLIEKVSEELQPIMNEITELNLNQKLSEGVQNILHDYDRLEANVKDNFSSLVNDITALRMEITPHNMDTILLKLKSFSVKEYYENIDLHSLDTVKTKIVSELNELRRDLINQIDSREFDWMDFHLGDFMHSSTGDISGASETSHNVSRWPIFVFLFSAFICLICSASFHLFYVVNKDFYKIFLRLDYAGVSLLISGSTFPISFYGFFCQMDLAIFYLACVGVAALIVFFVSLQDFIHQPEYLNAKSYMYGGLGIFAAVPMIHLAYFEIFDQAAIGHYTMTNSLVYYILMGVAYLGGLTIYATRCPERYKPGQFDICGASHQLWHISILIAIVLTYVGSIINFYTRKMNTCPASL